MALVAAVLIAVSCNGQPASPGATPTSTPGSVGPSPTTSADAELSSGPPVVHVSGSPDPSPLSPGPDAVSVSTSPAGATVLLDAQPGVRIVDATAVTGLPPLPDGAAMPLGALSFALEGVAVGGSATVTLFLPAGTADPGTYLRYGPEPAAPQPHWYDFSWDLTAGAERTGGGRLVLHFVDGGRGDDDLTANGRIVDAGGPADDAGAPPDASMAWNYGRYDPMTVFLTSSSTGTITRTQWLTPDGRVAVGRDLTWSATGGPAGTMRRFVLAVTDGTVWSTREIFIAVPPVMHLGCHNRIESADDRTVAFDGDSNYWPVYGWSTNVGTNVRFGDKDEAVVWYEWDPGNGEPPIAGRTVSTHQNDFKADYQYGQGPSYPTHYTATLHAGVYIPGTRIKLETASCETQVQFPIPAYDLAGTITIEIQASFLDDSVGQHVVRTETTHGTITVAMRTDPNDPTSYIDAGSTFKVDRSFSHERTFGDCVESFSSKSNGTYYFTDAPAPPPDTESGAPSVEPTPDPGGHSAIWGIENRDVNLLVIGNAEYYPQRTEEHQCFPVDLPTPPLVIDAWTCGHKIGLGGLGIEGTIIDLPSGPDRVDIDCTEEGPSIGYDKLKTTAKGTLTIIGH